MQDQIEQLQTSSNLFTMGWGKWIVSTVIGYFVYNYFFSDESPPKGRGYSGPSPGKIDSVWDPKLNPYNT